MATIPLPQHNRRSVAVLIGTERQFYRDVLRGVGEYLQHHDRWSISSEPTLLPLATTRRAFASVSKECSGVIAMVGGEAQFQPMRRRGLAVVNLSSVYSHPDLPSVTTDCGALASLAFEYFMERGFRTFAYCDLDMFSKVRRLPFVAVVEGAGFTCHSYEVDEVRDGDWRTGRDRLALARWLAGLPKPVAILAHNDIRGRHLIEVAANQGIRVPEEACILGVDNELPHCELCSPALSSIEIDAVRIGHKAAALLDQAMDGGVGPDLHVEFPPLRVVTRRSTDIRVTVDPVVSKAMRYISQHATEGIDTTDVIRHLIVSRTALGKRFLRTLGYTPHEAIVRARIEAARHLLRDTKLTIDVIAERTGFRHGEYLTAVFRQRYGMTPRDYRDQRGGEDRIPRSAK
jgi:LacI family transcriptional regulator